MAVIAVPVYRSRVAPVFDFSSQVLLINTSSGNEEGRTAVPFHGQSHAKRIDLLVCAGVTTLICGGISEPLLNILKNHGIDVIWGIAGPVEDVLEAYMSDYLHEARFKMPGSGFAPTVRSDCGPIKQ